MNLATMDEEVSNKNPGRLAAYLVLWIDDFSRKILFGKYYLGEKLPSMEDSFKYMLLRWGIPLVVFADNGKVHVSRQFRSVLAELRIHELRHKPYQTFAKGKVEAVQKIINNEVKNEAARVEMRTMEELNTAFWHRAEMEYNTCNHSSTGQAPEERFQQGLRKDHYRVKNFTAFLAMFLWKEPRTVNKWGKVSLYHNQYPKFHKRLEGMPPTRYRAVFVAMTPVLARERQAATERIPVAFRIVRRKRQRQTERAVSVHNVRACGRFATPVSEGRRWFPLPMEGASIGE